MGGKARKVGLLGSMALPEVTDVPLARALTRNRLNDTHYPSTKISTGTL